MPHIASFNHFVDRKLKIIVMENSELKIESDRRNEVHELKFVDVYMHPPSLREADGRHHLVYPYEARIRELSYNFSVFVNVLHTVQ